MPRTARLDYPGLLQHVIVRGNERREIFKDDHDRRYLQAHLATLLEEAGTRCYAWALMPNHFHLLLRPDHLPLAVTMRRLLTGYAVHFNTRHDRCGHLFQNRYKSIACQKESYFLELIRYIHLNPVRGGVVSGMAELEWYPWTGHRAILGLARMTGQDVSGVLWHFSEDVVEARRLYRAFVADGEGAEPPPGHTDEEMPGRPRGRRKNLPESKEGDRSSAGVYSTSPVTSEAWMRERVSETVFGELVARVACTTGVDEGELLGNCRRHEVCEARCLLCCLAVRHFGLRGTDLARFYHIVPSAVSRMVRRGEALLRENPHLKGAIGGKV